MSSESASRRAVRFEGLPRRTRLDVEAAAKRIELHPDPAIAASSIEWARRHPVTRRTAGQLALLAVGAVMTAATFGDLPDGDGLRDFWREHRLRKRITKIEIDTGFDAPAWALVPTTVEARVPVDDLVAKSGLAVEALPARRRPRHSTRMLRWPR